MMHPNKTPGPDEFMVGFYQKHWSLVGQDVSWAVLGFLNGGDMPEIVNNTVLVLISKVKHPHELTQFRLCATCSTKSVQR